MEITFLTLEVVLEIQRREAALTNSPTMVRNMEALEAAVAAPQASFDGQYLMDPFEMAASYVVSLAVHHPFLDANKRTAAAAALTFLDVNRFDVTEIYEEELADKLLEYLEKRITKDHLAAYFRSHSQHLG